MQCALPNPSAHWVGNVYRFDSRSFSFHFIFVFVGCHSIYVAMYHILGRNIVGCGVFMKFSYLLANLYAITLWKITYYTMFNYNSQLVFIGFSFWCFWLVQCAVRSAQLINAFRCYKLSACKLANKNNNSMIQSNFPISIDHNSKSMIVTHLIYEVLKMLLAYQRNCA